MTPPAVSAEVLRLNWGCGAVGEPGWINSDLKRGPGIQIPADIRAGLPVRADTFDYVVSIHALPELPYPDLVPALQELRRVLKPGGILRLALPDLDKGIAAYRRQDAAYFEVSDDDARSIGAKLVTQLTWFGYSRSLFNWEFTREILERAGFHRVTRCPYAATATGFREITALDNRPRESLFVEASK